MPINASADPTESVHAPSAPRWVLAFALLAWLGVMLQLPLSIGKQLDKGFSVWWGLVMYFGYFTIVSNIVCALVLTAHARARWLRADHWLRSAWLAASATVAIAITFLVYNLVLRSQSQAQGYSLGVDTILHVLTPLAMMTFWWRTTPRGTLRWNMLPLIAAYPSVYMIYYFIRGALIEHYPYFFMNVTNLGYAVSVRNAALVVVVFTVLACGMVAINRRGSGGLHK